MKRLPILLSALFLVSVLGGCVGGDDSIEPQDDLRDDAEEAKVTATTGSIQGTVASDIFEPLAGARVALIESAQETQVARNGEFTINDVEPGRYTMRVEALGFLPQSRAVEVKAGEVTEVAIQLEREPSTDPYIESHHIVEDIGTGVAWQVEVPGQGCVIGPLGIGYDKTCGGFGGVQVFVNVTPAVETVLVELVWDPAGPLGENLQLDLICESAPRGGGDSILDTEHPCYYAAPGRKSPLISRADKADSEEHGFKWQGDWDTRVFAAHGTLGTYELIGSDVGVTYEQKFEFFISLAHRVPLPEEFSGIPDR